MGDTSIVGPWLRCRSEVKCVCVPKYRFETTKSFIFMDETFPQMLLKDNDITVLTGTDDMKRQLQKCLGLQSFFVFFGCAQPSDCSGQSRAA